MSGYLDTKGNIKKLDLLVRAGEVLSQAVDSTTREELKALADRCGADPERSTKELRRVVKRHLVGVARQDSEFWQQMRGGV